MESKGKIFVASPETTGTSKRTGQPWMSRDLVFELENGERIMVRAGTNVCGEIRNMIEHDRNALFEIKYWSSVRNYFKADGSMGWLQENTLDSITVVSSL